MMDKENKNERGIVLPNPEEIFSEERFFHEINILRIEGFYFCHDPKAAAKQSGKLNFLDRLKNPQEVIERPITIEVNPQYGRPSVLSYKILQAVWKKLSDYGFPIPNKVSFTQHELARLIGRKTFGGKDSREFLHAVMQLKHTNVWCTLYNKEIKQGIIRTFSFLNIVDFITKNDRICQCVFHIEPFFVESLNNRYMFCLNYSRMRDLEPIAIALFKRLFFHFSSIYGQKQTNDFYFSKDYQDICNTWLGGLKVLKYKYRIAHEQLGRHLEALKKTRLIRRYAIEKNTSGDGFNIVFCPGKGFFEDYRLFYDRAQLTLQFNRAFDENKTQKPMSLVRYFYQRLYQTDSALFDELDVSEKEVNFASTLLDKHSFEEACDFIHYGLKEAQKTKFDIKTFGGIKKYHPLYLKEKENRAASVQWEQEQSKKREEERIYNSYLTFRKSKITKVREKMSPEELKDLERQVREELEAEHPHSPLLSSWVRVRTDLVLTKRFGVPEFDEWRKEVG
jgi:hypothetical protein